MTGFTIATLRHALSVLLILGGASAIAGSAMESVHAAIARRHSHVALTRALLTPAAEARLPAAVAAGEPIGLLEIPRLALSGVVTEGDDAATLAHAIGHLPDTPLPWHPGNSAMAAHRDTLFKPLERVRLGDVVRLTTPHGKFEYRVRSTHVVDRDDLWVLDPTPASSLTLITCHPFGYIGPAPRRFIVRAERIHGP